MIRFFLLLPTFLFYFSAKSQITITNQLVKDSLKSRINAIHAKIYTAVESGKLTIYDYDGKIKDPSTVLTPCISTDSIECDSSKVSINEFRNFSFNYLKKFDFETMNTSLTIESLDISYRVFFAGVDLNDAVLYRFKYTDLVNILSDKDIEFLKYLSISYHDNDRLAEMDSITFANGYRGKGFCISENGFYNDEINRSKLIIDTGYSYQILIDSLKLKIISEILFYQFNKKYYLQHPIPLFKDFDFQNQINQADFISEIFEIKLKKMDPEDFDPLELEWNILCEDVFINELVIAKEKCNIKLRSYDHYKPINENETIKIYYIKPENLPDFLGKFQYLFLKNLFGF